MINLENEIVCTRTNELLKSSVQLNNKNELNSENQLHGDCTHCIKIISSKHNQAFDGIKNQESIKIPDKTLFFHSNNETLYSDSRFENPDFYKDKIILIVGTGSVKRKSILNNLKKLNFRKTVNLVIKKTWATEYFDDFIIAESDNVERKEETLAAVKAYMTNNCTKFDAIMTYDEFCVLMTAYLTQELNLNGIPFEVACRIRNKSSFRKYCEQLDINCPKNVLVESKERCQHVTRIDKFFCEIKTGEGQEEKTQKRLLQQLATIEPPFIIKNKYGLGKGKLID